jgi:excisionase family DNA binding protein
MTQWMTIDEAAAYLRVGKTTMYKLLADGEIKPFKIGRKNLFRPEDLDRFLLEQAA